MRPAPEQTLDPKAVSLWRVHAALRSLFYGVFVGASGVSLALALPVPAAVLWFFGVGFVAYSTLVIGVIPPLRYKYWRYRVDERELDLQFGVFVIQRTLVPLVRVQNVNSAQGPLAKHFGLSSVTVSTAASTHEIPALSDAHADKLRDYISRLAQVARESL